MSEKQDFKDDASKRAAARVRDNQRRARERHKAYFQDLQRKVSEYEKQGVQATLDMQQAARHVAVENERLRLLLRNKGVEDHEVAAFLKGFDGTVSTAGGKRNTNCGKRTDDTEFEATATTRPTVSLHPLPVDFTNYQPDGLAILADVSAQQKCCNGRTQCTDPAEDKTLGSKPFTQPATATIAEAQAPMETNHIDNLSSSTTMSCIAAAKIVADLQGHGDSERARASLGCCDEGECTVKNTAVFQVMDRG